MKISEFIKKIQSQPEHIRRIILWSVVVILSLGFFFIWLYGIKIKLKSFQKETFFESIGVPKLKEEIKETPETSFPEIKIPELSEEEIKKLEELMKEAEQEKSK